VETIRSWIQTFDVCMKSCFFFFFFKIFKKERERERERERESEPQGVGEKECGFLEFYLQER
jgi:hypothetical protein